VTASAQQVRVTVLDTWDEIPLTVSAETPLSEIKRTALARSRARGVPDEYVIKYNGAELYEAGTTLADAGVAPNAALIVLRRRRTPVR
jgi:hypothetical protein